MPAPPRADRVSQTRLLKEARVHGTPCGPRVPAALGHPGFQTRRLWRPRGLLPGVPVASTAQGQRLLLEEP